MFAHIAAIILASAVSLAIVVNPALLSIPAGLAVLTMVGE